LTIIEFLIAREFINFMINISNMLRNSAKYEVFFEKVRCFLKFEISPRDAFIWLLITDDKLVAMDGRTDLFFSRDSPRTP